METLHSVYFRCQGAFPWGSSNTKQGEDIVSDNERYRDTRHPPYSRDTKPDRPTVDEAAERESRLLRATALGIAAATDLTAALRLVLREVCEVTGWAVGQVWLPSDDGSVLECGPAWYSRDPATKPFRDASRDMVFAPGVGLPGAVWSSKQPAWHCDVALDESLPRMGIAGQVGLKAGLAIPVLADDELVAVLEFYVREERDEDTCLTTLVGVVAAQLGTVIRRRRIEEEL